VEQKTVGWVVEQEERRGVGDMGAWGASVNYVTSNFDNIRRSLESELAVYLLGRGMRYIIYEWIRIELQKGRRKL
jgi:hypothetical protein